ncbi:UNVERIFIED_CONTAM: hypothetical protein FKN15_000682 [Acipenser sinensis]
MANQIMELMHLKYERAHLAYLIGVQNIRDGDSGVYGQSTIGQSIRQDNTPAPFGGYGDHDGWCGTSVSAFCLMGCLLQEYQRQEPAINKHMQGTFGLVIRSDHTRKIARKLELRSGAMSSYNVMNENWMILSWVMVQIECERSLEPMFHGLAKRYEGAAVEKAQYHWVDSDQADLQKLKDAYSFCGTDPPNPTKQHIREHCRMNIPRPEELVQRVEGVLNHFFSATDVNGVLLFNPPMLQVWRIQRVHILCACLSDPK